MPGTYSKLVTVTTGQTITAAERNNEHDNHITNCTPDGVDDASADLTAMQTTADPYPASVASLATDLRGEIKRLRYVVAQITGQAQWYIDPTQLLSGDGTVSIPMYSFAADPDCGLYRVTTNTIAFATNGIKQLEISAAAITAALPLAMGSSKITGMANGTASGEGIHYGQYQNTLSNILDNGGFEIWQRGTSFSAPADAAYTADRWQAKTDEAANVTVTKETTTIDSVGLASMKVVITSAGASKKWYVQQLVENYADYRGKTVTVSVRVNSNVASAIRIGLQDSVASASYSSYHSGGSTWETLSVSLAVNAATTSLTILLGMPVAADKKNGTTYFDSAMLIVGSEIVSFVGTTTNIDLNRCMRFFQVLGGESTTEPLWSGFGNSTTQVLGAVRFIVPMRAAPTVTANNATHFTVTGGATAVCTATAIDQLTTKGGRGTATVAAGLTVGQAYYIFTNTADATYYLTADL